MGKERCTSRSSVESPADSEPRAIMLAAIHLASGHIMGPEPLETASGPSEGLSHKRCLDDMLCFAMSWLAEQPARFFAEVMTCLNSLWTQQHMKAETSINQILETGRILGPGPCSSFHPQPGRALLGRYRPIVTLLGRPTISYPPIWRSHSLLCLSVECLLLSFSPSGSWPTVAALHPTRSPYM